MKNRFSGPQIVAKLRQAAMINHYYSKSTNILRVLFSKKTIVSLNEGDARNSETNENQVRYVFVGFIWFSLFFYIIAWFFGGGQYFRHLTPWYLLISRDLIYTGLFLYIFVRTKTFIPRQAKEVYYAKFMRVFAILIGFYVIIVLTHLPHKNIKDILQHNIRNILFYSAFLPFLPTIFKKKENFKFLQNNILNTGLIMALLGILSRYIGPTFLTWNGRVVSTMGDPNNFAIFLSLCLFIVAGTQGKLGFAKTLSFYFIYLVAFVMANSITAFLVASFGLIIIFLLDYKVWKGFLYWIIIVCSIFSISVATKILERPYISTMPKVKNFNNVDRYFIIKFTTLLKQALSDIYTCGLTSEPIERANTLEHREHQWRLAVKGNLVTVDDKDNKLKYVSSILLGDFQTDKYLTYDSQYFNLMANSGVISILIFVVLFGQGVYTGFRLWFRYRNGRVLSFAVFILSMLLVGFNGMAFLNRFPLNFLFYLSLGMIFMEKDVTTEISTRLS